MGPALYESYLEGNVDIEQVPAAYQEAVKAAVAAAQAA